MLFEHVVCNLCSSEDFKILYKNNLNIDDHADIQHFVCTNSNFSRHGQIVKCGKCGLVYTNPRLKSEYVYRQYQAAIDPVYLAEKKGRHLTFTHSLNEIEELAPKGKILDVGCYAGFFLEVAKERGWQIYGLEPSVWASQYARDTLGLDIKTAAFEQAGFSEKEFDVVTLWDTLEHLMSPVGTLKQVHRVLKDEGLICASTINIDSLFARVLGGKWPQLMQMHMYYYSPDTLSKLFTRCGFKITSIRSHKKVLRAGYLIGKIGHFSSKLSNILSLLSKKLGIDNFPVTVDFGDLITIYAKKLKI